MGRNQVTERDRDIMVEWSKKANVWKKDCIIAWFCFVKENVVKTQIT